MRARILCMQRTARPLKFIPPMECRHTAELPEGEDWQYELKLDGYRLQAIKNGGEVRLYSRNGKPFEARFPEVATAVRALRAQEFVLDGELVAIGVDGAHSFSALQKAGSSRPKLRVYVFDLLVLDGKDLLKQPLSRRRQLLQAKIPMPADSLIQLGPVFAGDVGTIMAKVRESGFEGLVAKRLDSIYRPGEETGAWLKHKTQATEDFVVGGIIATGGRLEEIVVGRRQGKRLVFVDSVRNGFVSLTRKKVMAALAPLKADVCPFANLPEKKGPHRMDREKMEEVTWFRPVALAEIAFNEVTTTGHLRHSKFLRLREVEDIRAK